MFIRRYKNCGHYCEEKLAKITGKDTHGLFTTPRFNTLALPPGSKDDYLAIVHMLTPDGRPHIGLWHRGKVKHFTGKPRCDTLEDILRTYEDVRFYKWQG